MPFSDIRGLDRTLRLLKRSVATGRIAHAYLFEGIEGCGKKKTAHAFIEAVFCGREEGCGTCSSCRKMAASQHPDLHVIEPDGAFIKIDQIRELQKTLSYRPFEASKKACIIDSAERLNPAAGNALLKTLEEPPGNALLILITSNAGAVLPTIRSRCQVLNFPVLPQASVEEHLLESGIAPETARIAASLAGGSMRKALDTCGEEALIQRVSLFERVAALSLRDIGPLFAAAEELAGEKDKIQDILELLSVFLRDALLSHEGSTDIVNADLMPLIRRESECSSRERIMEKLRHVGDARQALMRNVNARLALEVLFMRLARTDEQMIARH